MNKKMIMLLLGALISHASIMHAESSRYNIHYPNQVKQLIGAMNPQNMWNDLTTFTNFPDRYPNSDSGINAADWVKSQVEMLIKTSGRDDVTVYTIAAGKKYKQSSLVVKFGNSSLPGIVVGAHVDTYPTGDKKHPGKKPGADDDGSGVVTVLENMRTLLFSGMHFKKPIYFIWYAAEEEDKPNKSEGLQGSEYVVKYFQAHNIAVDAVLQLDMTGYLYKHDPAIWLNDDYVNKNLNSYLEKLIIFYVKQPVKHSTCGTPCSDHYSWYEKGFATTFPFEAAIENPSIHTPADTMDKLSLTHMSDFLKMAIAFSVELAEPVAN
jgi:leucyl aminopeptidase